LENDNNQTIPLLSTVKSLLIDLIVLNIRKSYGDLNKCIRYFVLIGTVTYCTIVKTVVFQYKLNHYDNTDKTTHFSQVNNLSTSQTTRRVFFFAFLEQILAHHCNTAI
jgi:hypothetical protein